MNSQATHPISPLSLSLSNHLCDPFFPSTSHMCGGRCKFRSIITFLALWSSLSWKKGVWKKKAEEQKNTTTNFDGSFFLTLPNWKFEIVWTVCATLLLANLAKVTLFSPSSPTTTIFSFSIFWSDSKKSYRVIPQRTSFYFSILPPLTTSYHQISHI